MVCDGNGDVKTDNDKANIEGFSLKKAKKTQLLITYLIYIYIYIQCIYIYVILWMKCKYQF